MKMTFQFYYNYWYIIKSLKYNTVLPVGQQFYLTDHKFNLEIKYTIIEKFKMFTKRSILEF